MCSIFACLILDDPIQNCTVVNHNQLLSFTGLVPKSTSALFQEQETDQRGTKAITRQLSPSVPFHVSNQLHGPSLPFYSQPAVGTKLPLSDLTPVDQAFHSIWGSSDVPTRTHFPCAGRSGHSRLPAWTRSSRPLPKPSIHRVWQRSTSAQFTQWMGFPRGF